MNKSYFTAFDFSDFSGDTICSKSSDGGVFALMSEVHKGLLRDSVNLQHDMFIAMKGEHDRYQKTKTHKIGK